jgi:hypothetical protein
MPKPVYEEGDVTVLWNQVVHSDEVFTVNRPDIIIKKKKRKHAHWWMWQYPQTEMLCKKKRKRSSNRRV